MVKIRRGTTGWILERWSALQMWGISASASAIASSISSLHHPIAIITTFGLALWCSPVRKGLWKGSRADRKKASKGWFEQVEESPLPGTKGTLRRPLEVVQSELSGGSWDSGSRLTKATQRVVQRQSLSYLLRSQGCVRLSHFSNSWSEGWVQRTRGVGAWDLGDFLNFY